MISEARVVVPSKLPQVGATIFSVMSKLAAEYGAVNLSQGFPDFNCSEKLIELVHRYMKEGYNQYAPMPGIVGLRERMAEMVSDLYGMNYHPDSEITITSGATQAIYTAITAFVKEGDEVIVFEPAYDCYVPAIQLAGGKPVYVQLDSLNFSINWEDVKRLISHRTRLIITNNPHNPSGNVWQKSDLEMLDKLTRGTDILVLSDEVYEFMVFEGHEHESVASHKGLAERSIMVSSFGKTVHTTGWKIAYVLAPAYLMIEFRKVHQYLVFSVNTPIQYALADFLKDKNNYLELKHFYKQKRDYFANLMKGSRFEFEPSKGTYFQIMNYKQISDERDVDFATRLTIEHKVASIPLSAFYHEQTDNKYLRFCFAKKEETLEKAATILCKL